MIEGDKGRDQPSWFTASVLYRARGNNSGLFVSPLGNEILIIHLLWLSNFPKIQQEEPHAIIQYTMPMLPVWITTLKGFDIGGIAWFYSL